MHDILQAVAEGELTVAEAEAELTGYVTSEAGRFDAARETRRGVPEAILAEGKSIEEMAGMAESALETAGRAILTRVDPDQRDAVIDAVDREAVRVSGGESNRTIVLHAPDFEAPELDATVGVVTAGTSDGPVADEAVVIATEMGATVERFDDIGVAGVHRLFDHLDDLRTADVLVVAAGREGALPTVVAGLVDTPVIGLPTSIGYGEGGEGKAALLGMLQSCSVLTTVNIDAGFVAGAQAGLIARAIDAAKPA